MISQPEFDRLVGTAGVDAVENRVVFHVCANRFKNSSHRHHHSAGYGLRLRSVKIHALAVYIHNSSGTVR
jgi:hypothetical protein